MKTLIRILVSAFAFWLTTLIVGGSGEHGIWIEAYGELGASSVAEASGNDQALASFLVTLILIAVIFGLVNGTLGAIVRFVSIPIRILTLGLFGLIINGFMLVVVAWISDAMGFGLHVEGFWWGVLAAIVLSILTSIMNGLLGTSKRKDR